MFGDEGIDIRCSTRILLTSVNASEHWQRLVYAEVFRFPRRKPAVHAFGDGFLR